MNNNINIQNYLSVGYIVLIVLGIIKDTVYYGFLGINIMSYATFSDILISPIGFIVGSLKRLIATVVLIVLCTLFIKNMKKINAFFEKIMKRKNNEKAKKKSTINWDNPWGVVVFSAYFMASFFLGAGLGGGSKTAERIKNQKLEMYDVITFDDGAIDTTGIVGKTTDYIFYVKKDSKYISISPVRAIKEIVSIEEEEEQQ